VLIIYIMETMPRPCGRRQPQNTNAPGGTCEKGLLAPCCLVVRYIPNLI